MSFKVMSVLGASSVASIYGYANTVPESFSKLTKTIQDMVGQIIRSENINMAPESACISPVREDWLNKKITLVNFSGNVNFVWTGVIRSNGFYEGSLFIVHEDKAVENYYSNGSIQNNYRLHFLNNAVFHDSTYTDDIKNKLEEIVSNVFARGVLNQCKQAEQFLEPSEVISKYFENINFIPFEEVKRKFLGCFALAIMSLGVVFAVDTYNNRNQ